MSSISQGNASASAPDVDVQKLLSVTIEFPSERQTISGATLSTQVDELEPTYDTFRSEAERPTISLEYIGSSFPAVGATGAVSATIGGITVSGGGTCISSSVRASVGELVRGSATFRVQE